MMIGCGECDGLAIGVRVRPEEDLSWRFPKARSEHTVVLKGLTD
jgi:hypothetical protein